MPTTLDVIEGKANRNPDAARNIHRQLTEAYDFPQKFTRDGILTDVTEARRVAKDPEAFKERFGDEALFIRMAVAGAQGEDGDESAAAVNEVVERAMDTVNERAGEIDSTVVQDSTPVEVDPVIVAITDTEAPLLDMIDMEAQAGFTAQFNIISDRGPVEPGAITEAGAIDLSDAANTDWVLDNDSEDMTILAARVNVSDFSAQAWESLNWGGNDLEATTMGQVMIALARWRAGEMVYGDPAAALDDGSIQDANASPGLAVWAENADTENLTSINHVVDKSGLDVTGDRPRLNDLKSEITELVTTTGATYGRLMAICGPTFFDTIESEVDEVVRLDAYDEGIDFGGRALNVKGVPLRETRAVGRDEHGGYSYAGTGDTPAGNYDPNEGDVFIFDRMAFKRRQLAPLSMVPLARRGLSDEAVAFEYSANIDKSLGAHTKYLQAYPV